ASRKRAPGTGAALQPWRPSHPHHPEDVMSKHLVAHRITATSLVACLALAVVAPAAQAGQGRGSWNKIRRYDVGQAYGCDSRTVVRASCAPPGRVVQVVHRSSSGGSALAGFIGGLAIGVILSSA